MDFLILCGVTVIAVIIIFLFKQLKSGFAFPLALLLCFILLRQALSILQTEGEFLKTIFENKSLSQYGNILLKTFGISLIVELLSDTCREAGENSVASKIELLGKVEIIVLSLPLVKNILETVKSIML